MEKQTNAEVNKHKTSGLHYEINFFCNKKIMEGNNIIMWCSSGLDSGSLSFLELHAEEDAL